MSNTVTIYIFALNWSKRTVSVFVSDPWKCLQRMLLVYLII